MTFELPALPYDKTALEPHISAQTFDFHYGKHHAAYVKNLNGLLENNHDFSGKTLEEVIIKASNDNLAGIFNNAAQIWNHTFFWNSMSPNGGGAPSSVLADKIAADFGSLDDFKTAFKTAAATQFGSGWAWLVLNADKKLEIVKTANADTPLTQGKTPLLTLDVWEHAYYLDFQNRRPDFISTFLDTLIHWEFAEKNLIDALK